MRVGFAELTNDEQTTLHRPFIFGLNKTPKLAKSDQRGAKQFIKETDISGGSTEAVFFKYSLAAI